MWHTPARPPSGTFAGASLFDTQRVTLADERDPDKQKVRELEEQLAKKEKEAAAAATPAAVPIVEATDQVHRQLANDALGSMVESLQGTLTTNQFDRTMGSSFTFRPRGASGSSY
jgi:hypothetical protein